jgi:hypothetical protein
MLAAAVLFMVLLGQRQNRGGDDGESRRCGKQTLHLRLLGLVQPPWRPMRSRMELELEPVSSLAPEPHLNGAVAKRRWNGILAAN